MSPAIALRFTSARRRPRPAKDRDPSLGTAGWNAIVAVGDYGVSLGIDPRFPAAAAAAYPNYYGTGIRAEDARQSLA